MKMGKWSALTAILVTVLIVIRAEATLMHAPMSQMVANGNGQPTFIGPPPTPNDPNAQILSMNGIGVESLQLGTTTFSGNPGLQDQLPHYADEFGLSANASADGQTYVQTVFTDATAMVFLVEKGGNDPGTMVGLDENGQEIGSPIAFTAGGFNASLGYTVFQGQPAGGMVITSDTLIYGIRLYAPGIDPVSISSLPYEIVDSGEEFTWGARIADGSWSNTGGWQKDGVNTTDVPQVIQNPPALGSADPVRIVSGTVRVNTGDQSALSLQIDSGGTVNIASGFGLDILENTNVSTGGTLHVSGLFDGPNLTADGTVSIAAGVLDIDGGNLADVAVSGTGSVRNSGEVSVGKLTVAAGSSLVKQSEGTLVLNQTGGANVLPAGSSIDIEEGVVGAVNGAVSDSLGTVTVNLEGGDLQLGRSSASPTAFDAPITVSAEGAIRASQVSGALAGGSVTLGGTHGISIPSGGRAIVETADGYSLTLAGATSGAGRLIFGDGADVTVAAAVSTATVEFRGDTSGLSGTNNVAPSQSRIFAPTAETPDMNVGFSVSGSAEVIIEGLVDGSVGFAGTTAYTGATTIRRGALRQNSGLFSSSRLRFDGGRSGEVSLVGDYNDDDIVDELDHAEWVTVFGDTVSPGTGADGNGNGVVDAADYVLWRKTLGNMAGGGPDGTRLAVLESSGSSLALNIGSAVGELQWVGGGGFASRGNAATGQLNVTLEGGATLQWDSPTQGFNGQVLQLGSPSADGGVVLQNNIDLGSAEERVIQVANNLDTDADYAEISGVISSSGSSTDSLTINDSGEGSFNGGLLRLTGQNTFANKLRIEDATVEAEEGVGLPTSSNLEFSANNDNRPAIFATNGSFTRSIGTGPGQVFWADQGTPNPNAGGFAAIGGPLTVTLEGGAALTWDSPEAGFNGQDLQLGSSYGDDVVTFTNDITVVGNGRTIETFDNPFSDTDMVRLTGNVSSPSLNSLTVDGSARVVFDGTIDLAGAPGETAGDLIVRNSTTVILNGSGHLVDDVDIEDSANIFFNGAVTVADDVFFGDSSNQPQSTAGFGGDGTITTMDFDTTRIAVEASTRLRPGADRGEVGTLTMELVGGGSVEIETNSTYEMDFQNDGGTLSHDSVVVNGAGGSIAELALEPGDGDVWNLELNALDSLVGLVSGSDEFDLLNWNTSVDLIIDGTNISLDVGAGTALVPNVVVSSSTFDTTSAEVYYEVTGDFSGRIFVTGLGLLAGSGGTTSVPEPTTIGLAGIALVALLARRGRHRY
jgi:PEP-CTERM motif